MTQPQKFQRYRSVRRAPKQNIASSAPAAIGAALVRNLPVHFKNEEVTTKVSEQAVSTRSRHVHTEQATDVKTSAIGQERKRERPRAIEQAPTNYKVPGRAEREASSKATSSSDWHPNMERMAFTKISSTHQPRPRDAQTSPQGDKRPDIAQLGFDAPISAVNAGDRHVYVACNKSITAFPITPSTTAQDLLEAAAAAMPLEKVNTASDVLWEQYKPYKRPLRRYETIRDILNSWDRDEQNKLVIMPSQSGQPDDDLDIRSVPTKQPGASTYFIYHTNNSSDRKWSKRIITLHTNGQVTINKEGAKEKDQQNICHLSDCEIHCTSPRCKKAIKFPRPFGFAIKSQQKRAVFHPNEDNFVHFFSTKNKRLAESFYSEVQRWRSWHLVHVMGKTQKAQGQETSQASSKPIPTPKHQKSSSADVATNGLGPYKPLTSPSRFERSDHKEINAANLASRSLPKREDYTGEPYGMNRSEPVSRLKAKPPVSFPKKLTKDRETGAPTTGQPRPNIAREPLPIPELEPFADSGPLGNNYQERVQAQHQHLPTNPPAISPQKTSHAPTQYHNVSPTRAAFVRAAKPSGHRSSPTRTDFPSHDIPKPLIDLTPRFQEPPQHAKRERRIIPEHLPPSGLVEIATTPEVAINIPSATSWRRPGTSNGEDGVVKHVHGLTNTLSNGLVNGHPSGHANGPTNAHRSSNSHLRHRQKLSEEFGEHVQSHPFLQQQPAQPVSAVPVRPMQSGSKAIIPPASTSNGSILGRRGTLKTIGGPLNRSPKKGATQEK